LQYLEIIDQVAKLACFIEGFPAQRETLVWKGSCYENIRDVKMLLTCIKKTLINLFWERNVNMAAINSRKFPYKILLWIFLLILISYGLGRLYYSITGGFTESNITYALPYNPSLEVLPLSPDKTKQLNAILDQKFYYLGKGCQSYVFESGDGQYVIKFIKYQRFRPQFWLEYLTFIPPIERYFANKVEKKKQKLNNVFIGWKIAYESLQKETGVVYVHLNKSNDLKRNLVIYDKMGIRHDLFIDNFEFLIQKKARMLCPTLNEKMGRGEIESAEVLITDLLQMILDEYRRGYADNDHALMQNTGVLDNIPVHIDVGQFVKNQRVQNSIVNSQEIFNKTWKFRKWLEKHHPVLAEHVISLLKLHIGEKEFTQMKPRLNKAEMGIISHEVD
jgi:hypothetical protein